MYTTVRMVSESEGSQSEESDVASVLATQLSINSLDIQDTPSDSAAAHEGTMIDTIAGFPVGVDELGQKHPPPPSNFI